MKKTKKTNTIQGCFFSLGLSHEGSGRILQHRHTWGVLMWSLPSGTLFSFFVLSLILYIYKSVQEKSVQTFNISLNVPGVPGGFVWVYMCVCARICVSEYVSTFLCADTCTGTSLTSQYATKMFPKPQVKALRLQLVLVLRPVWW